MKIFGFVELFAGKYRFKKKHHRYTKMNNNQNDRPVNRLALALSEFERRFPSNDHCFREIFRVAMQEGPLNCHFCDGMNLSLAENPRMVDCLDCGKPFSLTAGTFFHRVKKIRAWFLAIWLREKGFYLSSSHFEKIADVAQSTAFEIGKRIDIVVAKKIDDDTDGVESSSFKDVVCKRSRETPKRQHPLAEVLESEARLKEIREKQEGDSFDCIDDDEQNPEKKLLSLLSDEPVSFDYLCENLNLPPGNVSHLLTILELDNKIERLANQRFKSNVNNIAALPARTEINRPSFSISDFVGFIRNRFHGISRKYLQTYIGEYWMYRSRNLWGRGKILKVCLESSAVGIKRIRKYVSPDMISLPGC